MSGHQNRARLQYGLPLEPIKLLSELWLKHTAGCTTTAVALPWDKLGVNPALPWSIGFGPSIIIEPWSLWRALHRKKHGFSIVIERILQLAAAAPGPHRFQVWEDVRGIEIPIVRKWESVSGQTIEVVERSEIATFWRGFEDAAPEGLPEAAPSEGWENPLAAAFRVRRDLTNPPSESPAET